MTGYVPDDELPALLRSAVVPVAPHEHLSASGSINSWIGAGRRPLVPRSDYVAELEERSPGCVWVYDDLRAALARAWRDPAATWLPGGTPGRPPWPTPRRCWSRCSRGPVPAGAMTPPTVSVVVPHHESPHDLDLLLTALELQDHPLHLLDVVVADDGSGTLPDPGPRPYAVRVVAQADDGFRAAAARNLGAAAARGAVLCFLDADTVPEPGYVSAVVRHIADGADLVVGRRRHADLGATSPGQLRRWLTEGSDAPEILEEPAWLPRPTPGPTTCARPATTPTGS